MTLFNPPRIAALSAELPQTWAMLSAEIVPEADGWVQLLPAGSFNARDGRPSDTVDGQWHLDATIAAQFIAATKAMAPKVLIDYDHQALKARELTGPVPAAAWLSSSDIEWREGKGIFIKPAWTSTAQSLIENREYGFLSAVFPYDEQGRPLYLRMAALTNDPAVLGMEPLALLAADMNISFHTPNSTINLYGQAEDAFVNELLKQLLSSLGIEIGENGEATEEQSKAALAKVDELKQAAEKSGELEEEVAALSAAYNGVTERVAELSAQQQIGAVDSIINAAKADGRIVEAEVAHLTYFGQRHGMAELSAMLDKRPKLAALSSQQTTTTEMQVNVTGDLSDEDLAVLSACGLDKETFLKNKD
uniref:phage protease n=1 Tax=Thaumasiovibrio occultus TaxID=1891184 RepID=UPI000B3580A7|nr:phage protease [Thaumasiovibrio occultus]